MLKHKSFWLKVLIPLLLLGTAVGVFLYIRSHQQDDASTNKAPLSDVVKPEEYLALDKINGLYSKEDYKGTINAVKKYVETTAPDRTMKLGALLMCVDSAVAIKDSESKETCYQKGLSLLATEPDDFTKTRLTATFTSIYSGGAFESEVAGDAPRQ